MDVFKTKETKEEKSQWTRRQTISEGEERKNDKEKYQ